MGSQQTKEQRAQLRVQHREWKKDLLMMSIMQPVRLQIRPCSTRFISGKAQRPATAELLPSCN
ncbi:uncharacterized protein METZ01_LOCUS480412 [marine metagenome]|uniref:Uncharacterized protein n=1 Tax=marine metagenome TaxID=408172 RepID=A0A383C7I9_9ZZZZ